MIGFEAGSGVVVMNVEQGTEASDILMRGDVIVGIDGQPIRSVEEYDRVLSEAGEKAQFELRRRRYRGVGKVVLPR